MCKIGLKVLSFAMPEEVNFTSSLKVGDVSKTPCLGYVQAVTAPKALIPVEGSRWFYHAAHFQPAAPGGGTLTDSGIRG